MDNKMDKIHTTGNHAASFALNFKIRASEVGNNLHKVKIYVSEEGEDKQIAPIPYRNNVIIVYTVLSV